MSATHASETRSTRTDTRIYKHLTICIVLVHIFRYILGPASVNLLFSHPPSLPCLPPPLSLLQGVNMDPPSSSGSTAPSGPLAVFRIAMPHDPNAG